uniref:Homing endonuclease n=2 Tax=Antipathidae TaxID=44169 RepID=A0A6M4RGZ0_9CNID|nr:homing endonuclease [Antipathes cf. dichotoma NB-2020]QJS34644.1 homing endonuclease [Stichopathes abyssicola]
MANLQNFKDSKDFQWLLGFIEAEGRSYVSKRKYYGEERFHVTWSLLQPLKTTQILYYIKRLFGCGHIRTTNVVGHSPSQLRSWPSNRGSSHARRFIFSNLESPISTYYITNKTHLSCVLLALKRGAPSRDVSQRGGIETLKYYDLEQTLRALTIFEKKGRFNLIEEIGDAAGRWEEEPAGLGSRLSCWLKSPKDGFFEEVFVGLADGGGALLISYKSRAEYAIEGLPHRKTIEPYNNPKKTILSFVIARKAKNLFVLKQLKKKLSGRLGLKFNMKGSIYVWEISNEKALAQIKILFKKHPLRTKKKVEFLKWCKSLGYVLEDRSMN